MQAITTGAKIDDRELVKAVIEPEKG